MGYFCLWTLFGMVALPAGERVARAMGVMVVGAGRLLLARAAGLQ